MPTERDKVDPAAESPCTQQDPDTIATGSLSRRFRVAIRYLAVIALLSLALEGCALYCQTRVFNPVGTISEEVANSAKWNALFPGMALVLLALLCLLVAAICLAGGAVRLALNMFPRTKRLQFAKNIPFFTVALTSALAFVEVTASFYGAERVVFRRIFSATFTATAERARVVIDAIEAYKQTKGEYPARLANLVPKFIPEIPTTGLAGYPQFLYRRPEDDKGPIRGYELMIETPSGGLNWDVFVYWPGGNYPDYFYGGTPELFGKWAYVHE